MKNDNILKQSIDQSKKHLENIWRCFGAELRQIVMAGHMSREKIFPLLDVLLKKYDESLVKTFPIDQYIFVYDTIINSLEIIAVTVKIANRSMTMILISKQLQSIVFSHTESGADLTIYRNKGVLSDKFIRFAQLMHDHEINPVQLVTTEALKAVIKTARKDKVDFDLLRDDNFSVKHDNPGDDTLENSYIIDFDLIDMDEQGMFDFVNHLQANYARQLRETLGKKKLFRRFIDGETGIPNTEEVIF